VPEGPFSRGPGDERYTLTQWQRSGQWSGLADDLPELLGTLRAFAIPMRTKFRGITVRAGALIQGPAGWGEFSPFAEYGPAESARWLASAVESATVPWPAPARGTVPVNVTVPAVGPERAYEIVAASGCRTAKVKVAEPGQDEAADIERVAAVRDALDAPRRGGTVPGGTVPGGTVSDGRIRVDANGAWTVDQAVRVLRALEKYGLEYAEQPCATLDELASVRRLVDIPVAADESIRRAEDPLRVRAAGAADIVMLKVQPLGGVRAALQVAEACGLPVVVSSAVDTSVGLAAGVALAAALPELPYACGLATMSLLAGDVTADPLAESGGALPVRRPPVDPDALSRWETDPGPWRERAAAAAEYLT
jgi:O-succinylbenzoate synthase